jgi:hypothetical protein
MSLFSSLSSVGSAAGVPIPSLNSLTQQALSKVQTTLLNPNNPVGALAGKATQITQTLSNAKNQMTGIVDKVAKAPDIIAAAAADAVGEKLKAAGISAKASGSEEASGADEASGANENASGAAVEGAPPTSADPNSVENTELQSGGSPYEVVHLTKKIRDPLFVFYMAGKPIYYTRNSKGRVKILPLYADVKASRQIKRKSKKKSRKSRR